MNIKNPTKNILHHMKAAKHTILAYAHYKKSIDNLVKKLILEISQCAIQINNAKNALNVIDILNTNKATALLIIKTATENILGNNLLEKYKIFSVESHCKNIDQISKALFCELIGLQNEQYLKNLKNAMSEISHSIHCNNMIESSMFNKLSAMLNA